MNKLIRISPPAWIFGLTLLAIILTGRFVGTSPCERALNDCYAQASASYPDGASQQQFSAASCTASPCEVKKRGALVPLTILIAGFVFMRVWFRQNPRPVVEADASGNARAPQRPGEASGSARGSAKKSDPPATTLTTTPAITPATTPAMTPTAAQSSSEDTLALNDEETTFCVDALRGSEGQSKEELTGSLCRLIAPTTADQWKGARLADLDLLVKALAAGALFGPVTAKYRAGLRSDADTPAEATAAMQEQTKKALGEHCLLMLRQDMQSLVASSEYPGAVSRDIVTDIALALHDDAALSGLAKCGKPGLLRLSVFLA